MSAKKLADALLGWDDVSKALMRAALHLERKREINTSSRITVNAIYDSMPFGFDGRIFECCNRLMDATGTDQMDLSREEAIDALVAAAFWEVA